MVWGVLRTSKKVLWNAFLGPTNHFNHSIFKLKKIFFSKFGGQKNSKKIFLDCGIQKRFLDKILIDYIYPAHEIWDHLNNWNMLEKSILRLLGRFWAFF